MKELSKARVTVSMDRGLWSRGKVRAHELNVSFSAYLEGLISEDLGLGGGSQLDRIEEKLDLLLGDRPPGEKISRGDMVTANYPHKEMDLELPVKNIRSDDEVINEAQEKLKKIRERKRFSEISDTAVENFDNSIREQIMFNPQPKRVKK